MSGKFKRILYGGDYNPNQWPKEIWKEDMAYFKDARINSATMPAPIPWCIRNTQGPWQENWPGVMETIPISSAGM